MTDDTNNYTPIECGLHSEYELAIMHKTKSILHWIDANNDKRIATVIPVDLFIRNKREYLKLTTDTNDILEIRLDKIIQLQPV